MQSGSAGGSMNNDYQIQATIALEVQAAQVGEENQAQKDQEHQAQIADDQTVHVDSVHCTQGLPVVRINKKVSQLMRLSGIRQWELAQYLGLSRSHLNRVLQGEVDTSAITLVDILRVLDIRVEDQIDAKILEMRRRQEL
jgi:DNA-binding Xre family transcriptional regulator